jgi:precorrin-2 dehydrogenase / sirohydrochlorin ferrochelatase
MSSLFPMFLKLEGKSCLVVGAGNVGTPKIMRLVETGAKVTVIALEAREEIKALAAEAIISLELRAFEAKDLHGKFLAVVATASSPLNRLIYEEAQRQTVLCNVVDVPELCDFYYPAIVQRGDLQIAISTNGQSPSLAQKLRQQLEKQFGPGYAQWVAELGATRKLVMASSLSPDQKRELLHSLASRQALEAALAKTNETKENEDRKVTV